jgi:hypothetical protein
MSAPVFEDALQMMKNNVDTWNKRDKKNEHAVFVILGGMVLRT